LGVGNIWRTTFVDGGGASLPLRAFFNADGSWDIENHGVSPDIAVKVDPAAELRGEDAQLDAAIASVPERRRRHLTPPPRRPILRFPGRVDHGFSIKVADHAWPVRWHCLVAEST
jgi:C-terminal processing protease CtpA/Prc